MSAYERSRIDVNMCTDNKINKHIKQKKRNIHLLHFVESWIYGHDNR